MGDAVALCSLKLHGNCRSCHFSPHSYFALSGFPSVLQVFSLKIKKIEIQNFINNQAGLSSNWIVFSLFARRTVM